MLFSILGGGHEASLKLPTEKNLQLLELTAYGWERGLKIKVAKPILASIKEGEKCIWGLTDKLIKFGYSKIY